MLGLFASMRSCLQTLSKVAKVKFLNGKVDIYRIEEEKESLEQLFIQESRS